MAVLAALTGPTESMEGDADNKSESSDGDAEEADSDGFMGHPTTQ